MNHQPFETWLLYDQPLTPEQKRDLQAHVRECRSCTAIAESNLALKSARMVAPAEGFTARFETRLARRRKQQRWHLIIGSLILTLGGLALFYWLASPLLQELLRSPAQWITTAVGYFLFILTSFRALSEIGSILLRVVPDVVPSGSILVSVLAVGGLALLWFVSVRRFGRQPQGV